MEKLIPMTDFVLEQGKKPNNSDFRERFVVKTLNYANFLKQNLNVSMFAPVKLVDGVWVILEEPRIDISDIHEYQSAQSNVLFEGFEVINDNITNGFDYIDDEFCLEKTIEDLLFCLEILPTLTATAKKILGL